MRGIEQKNELGARQVARDTRPLGVRFSEFLCKPLTLGLAGGLEIILSFVFPFLTDIFLLLGILHFWFAITRQVSLPYRMPLSSKLIDYTDLKPGTTIPKLGSGIAYFGNDRTSDEELWFNDSDLRTHVLIFGSTGSGKTEMLLGIAYNALVCGSGFIYIDGKGDNSLFAKVFSMVREMGREDDLLLINFMTGARDVLGAQENRLSNTMNPFALGSSSMLSQLIISLMDSGSGNQSGDMWKGRAMGFVEALMKVLTMMRDDGHLLLDAGSIRDYFILDKLEDMVVDKKFPLDDGRMIDLSSYPKQVLEPLKNYLISLPGYILSSAKKGKQAGEVREQHGFIIMQLTRIFGSLADTYGHIIRTNLAEVDIKDIVLNRRILVVLLPALEKSPEELSNLGKIIVASLKAMMAAGLGDAVEGELRDVIDRKPTNSPSPYTCIMDEYGYYAVPGFAVVPAQARSLGFSAVFAGQDLPAFQKASKEEAASIGANTNIKICMKLEDPTETWEFFNKTAGESYVTNVSGFSMQPDSVTLNYTDSRQTSVDRRQRIELLDLKDQMPGQAHFFFRSTIIRANVFAPIPKLVKRMRINHLLKVEPTPDQILVNLKNRLEKFEAVFAKTDFKPPEVPANPDIALIQQSFLDSSKNKKSGKAHERGVVALLALLEQEISKQESLSKPFEDKISTDEMSAFTRIQVNKMVEKTIGKRHADQFGLPLIRRGSLLEEIKHIERMSGKSETQAMENAKTLMDQIETLTKFPPRIEFARDIPRMLQDISDVKKIFSDTGLDLSTLPKNKRPDTTDLDDPEIAKLVAKSQADEADSKGSGGRVGAQSRREEFKQKILSEPGMLGGDSELPDLPELKNVPTLDPSRLESIPNIPKLPDQKTLNESDNLDVWKDFVERESPQKKYQNTVDNQTIVPSDQELDDFDELMKMDQELSKLLQELQSTENQLRTEDQASNKRADKSETRVTQKTRADTPDKPDSDEKSDSESGSGSISEE